MEGTRIGDVVGYHRAVIARIRDVRDGPAGYSLYADGQERYRPPALPSKTAAKMIARHEKAIRRHESGLDAPAPAVPIIAHDPPRRP